MSGLFGGTSNSVQQEVYSGIQVSTSLYGGCIPYVAGRQRIPTNLLWYGNFTVTTSNSGGGKGGGGSGTKQYSYSAAFIAGLCIGPIQGVFQVWHDKALVSLTFENLALALGSSGQPVWSGYPSGTPAGQQIPYDDLAYVASSSYNLGNSAAMPNLTFEVEGVVPSYSVSNSIFDADPSAVWPDYLLDPVHGALAGYPGTPLTIGSSAAPLTGATNSYQAYCMAMGLLTSPYEETQRQSTDFATELLQCTNSNCRLSVGTLEIIPYCDAPVSATVAGTLFSYTPNLTPIYIFTDDDYCPQQDEPPVSLKQTPLSDTYNEVNVEYLNRSNYYNTDSVNCSDLNDIALNGPRLASSLTLHQVTQASVAKTAGTLWLARQLYEINSYTFKVRSDYGLLEPLDLIALNDANLGLVNQVCQITEIEDDANNVLTITALELPGVTRSTAQYNWQAAQGYFANYATDPGAVQTPAIFVMPPIPASLSEGITVGIAVAGSSSNAAWLGCDVYCSVDGGTTYQFVGTVPEACRYGTLTANLSAVADPDTTSTLSVALADTQLQLSTAVTHADADAAQTLLLVGTGSTAEVMSYGTGSLVSAGHYNLSYLRRNMYGSTDQAHSSGAPFVRLDGAIFQIAFDPGMAGQTVDFKFVSFNTWHNYGPQTLAGATAYSYTIPASTAVSGSVQLVPRGNCAFTGESVYKNSGSAAWDSDCVGANPLTSGNISGQYGAGALAVGFVTSTSSTANPASNMYCIVANGTPQVQVIENGTIRYNGGAPAVGDLYDVRYDGFSLYYYINGVLVVTTPLQGASLFPAVAEFSVGAVFSDVQAASGVGATPTQFKAGAHCTVNDTNAMKIAGSSVWVDAANWIVSAIGYGTCHITAKPNAATGNNFMFGLVTAAVASELASNGNTGSGYSIFNYVWNCSVPPAGSANWFIEELGVPAFTGPAVQATDVAWITYDGSNVRYYLNDPTTPVHTTAVAGLSLYGAAIFFEVGSGLNSLRFGPTTNLAVADTSQIGLNAATDIYSLALVGPATTGTQTGVFAATIAVPAVFYNHTAIVTMTCDAWRSSGGGIWVEQDLHGAVTGGITSEERFLTQSVSPGERVTIQYEFANLAGTAHDYNLTFNTGSPSNTITVQNVRMQVEIIKR